MRVSETTWSPEARAARAGCPCPQLSPLLPHRLWERLFGKILAFEPIRDFIRTVSYWLSLLSYETYLITARGGCSSSSGCPVRKQEGVTPRGHPAGSGIEAVSGVQGAEGARHPGREEVLPGQGGSPRTPWRHPHPRESTRCTFGT